MSKILIVEDDPTLRSAYLYVLTKEGFIVESAQDGVIALRIAHDFEPDLILLDMLMANLGGVEFLRSYKLKDEHPNVKVIVFSNISVPEQMSEVMALGASHYLTKSQFTPKEIIKIIRETL